MKNHTLTPSIREEKIKNRKNSFEGFRAKLPLIFDEIAEIKAESEAPDSLPPGPPIPCTY